MAVEKGLYQAPQGINGEDTSALEVEIVNPDMVTLDDGSKVKINQQVAQMVTKTLDALKPITRKKVVQMLGKDSRTFKQAVQAIQRANK